MGSTRVGDGPCAHGNLYACATQGSNSEPVREWLDKERGTWNIGAGWPDPVAYTAAFGKADDILIHLHDIQATTYLGTP